MAPRSRRTLTLLLGALALATLSRTASAQSPPGDVSRARELFVQATDLRDQGDLPRALEAFKAAHTLADNPVTTFELARTYEALGKLVEARDTYASIARLPVQPDESERATRARQDGAKAADDLRSRLPTLSIKTAVPASSSGDRVEPAVPPANGESHDVVPTGPPALPPAPKAPTTAQLAPSAPASPASATSGPAAADGGNHFGPAAITGFTVGAGGFLVGSILAGATLSKASAIVTNCTTTACADGDKTAANSAKTLGIGAVVAYTISFVGAGVGVASLLLDRPAPEKAGSRSLHPWIGLGAAGLSGSF